MPALVRRAVKTVYFIALSLPVGRALGPAEGWFSYVWANRICEMLYGPDEIDVRRGAHQVCGFLQRFVLCERHQDA